MMKPDGTLQYGTLFDTSAAGSSWRRLNLYPIRGSGWEDQNAERGCHEGRDASEDHDRPPDYRHRCKMKMVCLKSLLLVVAMAFLASAGAPSAVAQTSYDTNYRPNKVMYAAKRANVRSGPGTSYKKVGLLDVGGEVLVAAKHGNWFKLARVRGQLVGFVYAPLLTEAAPAETIRTITYRSGARYRGEIRNGRRHGRGVYTWADGDRYEGDFVDGKRTGRGVYTWAANGHRYEGDFVDGETTGRGVYTWVSGDRYEGDFVDGKRTGRGVYTWVSGNRYEGDFVDGKRTGRGVYTWANGDRYEGGFLNGKRHGEGWYIWADGSGYHSNWGNGDQWGYREDRKAKWERHLAEWRREAGFDTTSGQTRQKAKKAPARQAVKKGGSASGGERWGAYVEVGKYWEDTEGYAVIWNASMPEEALDNVVDLCLERGRSHTECTNSKRMYVFSLNAPAQREKEYDNREDVGPYNEVIVTRNRCILVMKFGTDIERRFFDSDQAAVAHVDVQNSGRSSGTTRWSILKIACNDL